MMRTVVNSIEPHAFFCQFGLEILMHLFQVGLGQIAARNTRLIRDHYQPEARALQLSKMGSDAFIDAQVCGPRRVVTRIDEGAVPIKQYGSLFHLPVSPSQPDSSASTRSQRICVTTICSSCAMAVSVDGTRRVTLAWRSSRLGRSPVMAMTRIRHCWAAPAARMRFSDSPLVLNVTRRSPGWLSPTTCRANTSWYP